MKLAYIIMNGHTIIVMNAVEIGKITGKRVNPSFLLGRILQKLYVYCARAIKFSKNATAYGKIYGTGAEYVQLIGNIFQKIFIGFAALVKFSRNFTGL